MSTVEKGGKKNFLVTTILFSISFIISGILFINGYESSTTSKNLLRGGLTVLFGILVIMNYVNYKRAKD